jgi:hypothetical protein
MGKSWRLIWRYIVYIIQYMRLSPFFFRSALATNFLRICGADVGADAVDC